MSNFDALRVNSQNGNGLTDQKWNGLIDRIERLDLKIPDRTEDKGKEGWEMKFDVNSIKVEGGFRALGGPPGRNGENRRGYGFFGGKADGDGGMYSLGDNHIGFFTNAIERLTISDFRVGINTQKPRADLHIYGATGNADLRLEAKESANAWNIAALGNPSNAFRIAKWEDKKGYTDYFCIQPEGRVGIGTINPQATLDVEGDIRLGHTHGEGHNICLSRFTKNNHLIRLRNWWTQFISYQDQGWQFKHHEDAHPRLTIHGNGEGIEFEDGSKQKSAVNFQVGLVKLDRTLGSILSNNKDIAKIDVPLKGFHSTPSIQYGIVHLDSEESNNTRIVVNAVNVKTNRFTLEFQTWDRSVVYNCTVSWLAIGK